MRQISIFTIFCLTIFGCDSTADNQKELLDNSMEKQAIGKKFFDYDEIEHYTTNFEESKIVDLYDNQSKTEIDSFKIGVILGDIPKNTSDLAFIDKLAAIGYKKKRLPKSKFASIDKVFVEKSTMENLATSCIYVYRDILIFKKDSNVIGTAKICFDCKSHQINGTTASTENFGQEGDYKNLGNILRQ